MIFEPLLMWIAAILAIDIPTLIGCIIFVISLITIVELRERYKK